MLYKICLGRYPNLHKGLYGLPSKAFRKDTASPSALSNTGP